jgi:hypothetical protein
VWSCLGEGVLVEKQERAAAGVDKQRICPSNVSVGGGELQRRDMSPTPYSSTALTRPRQFGQQQQPHLSGPQAGGISHCWPAHARPRLLEAERVMRQLGDAYAAPELTETHSVMRDGSLLFRCGQRQPAGTMARSDQRE